MNDNKLNCVRYAAKGNDGFILERLKSLRDRMDTAETKLEETGTVVDNTVERETTCGAMSWDYEFRQNVLDANPNFGLIMGMDGDTERWSGIMVIEARCNDRMAVAQLFLHGSPDTDHFAMTMYSAGDIGGLTDEYPSFTYGLDLSETSLVARPILLTGGNNLIFKFKIFAYGNIRFIQPPTEVD